MYDVFISYSSYDLPWAERLHKDLTRDYPSLKIFFDRRTLKLGESFRDQLKNGTIATRYLVGLWSTKSRTSDEVRWEVAAFEANSQRQHIPMFLEGAYTPAEETQGLVAVAKAKAYDPDVDDRGTGKLDSPGVSQREWEFNVRKLGDTLVDTQNTTQPILLAVIAMPKDWLPELQKPGRLGKIHSAEYYLRETGLTWEDLNDRYAENAFGWQPFGDGANVIELLEAFRVRANRNIEGKGFHWRPVDLVNQFVKLQDEAEEAQLIADLSTQPSLVVVDPISLYHRDVQTVFLRLDKYMERESSSVVSFSPVNRRGVDVLHEALRQRTKPLLEQYFAPEIPPKPGAFAHCSLNLDSVFELERLVRWRLGALEAERRREEAKQATAMGR